MAAPQVPNKFGKPSNEIQEKIKSHYDSLKLMARYIVVLKNNNPNGAVNRIISSLNADCGKDVYTYQPDRASKVADKATETPIQDMEDDLLRIGLLKFGQGGFDLNPTQMNRVMKEFYQLEKDCNRLDDFQDKEYLTKAKSKLKDEGFKLPSVAPPVPEKRARLNFDQNPSKLTESDQISDRLSNVSDLNELLDILPSLPLNEKQIQSIVEYSKKSENKALSDFEKDLDDNGENSPLVSKIKDMVKDHYLEGGKT